MARRGWARLIPLLATAGPAVALHLVGASPAMTVDILRSADTWRLPTGPEVVLPAVAAAIAWLLIAWLSGVVTLMLAAQLRGLPGELARRLITRVAPLAVRRLAEAALGLTLASSAVATTGVPAAFAAGPPPATAASTAAAHQAEAPSAADEVVVSLDWPGGRAAEPTAVTAASPRPSVSATPSLPAAPPPSGSATSSPSPRARLGAEGARQSPASAPAQRTEVVVRRGDCLWAIAGRHLGSDATNARIATEWPRWYAVNRAVIGPNPHLLLPGQRLIAPN